MPELIYPYATTASHGITFGSQITIPLGYAGLVIMDNKPYDAIGPGEYTINTQIFPLLAQKLKLSPGQQPKNNVNISVFLLNILGPVVLTCRALPLVTKNRQHGVTYIELRTRCSVRIVNPNLFYSSLQKGWGPMLKKQSDEKKNSLSSLSMGKQAEAFLVGTVNAAMAAAIGQLKLAPERFNDARDAIGGAVTNFSVAALTNLGVECTGFEISNAPEVYRAPCAACKSVTAPTAYGVYKRTTSLLIVRFTKTREGNFCTPCAAKISAGFNGAMLVCGWWGYIGIVLTPIFLVQNCFYFLTNAFGPKAAAGRPVNSGSEDAGVWTPAPAADWGQETEEKSR